MFPLTLDLTGRPVMVVGGGPVALRKCLALVDAGADLLVVAPECCEELVALADDGRLRWQGQEFEPGDAQGRALVFAATDRVEVNDAVVRAARSFRVLVCVSGPATERGDFTVPATILDGGVVVAVSTGHPALTTALRDRIHDEIGARWKVAAALLDRLRTPLAGRGEQAGRARYWRELAATLPEELTRETAAQWLAAPGLSGSAGAVVPSSDEIESALVSVFGG